MFVCCVGFNILNVRFHQPWNPDFRAHRKLLGNALAITSTFVAHAVHFHFAIPAAVTGCVIIEHIQRRFTSVQAMIAQLHIVNFLRTADLILQTFAPQILVETFVSFHFSYSLLLQNYPFSLPLATSPARFMVYLRSLVMLCFRPQRSHTPLSQ